MTEAAPAGAEAGAEREPETESGPWWTGTTVAAGMTAVFTVLVALSAFLSAQAASDSADQYAESALALTDANFFFEQAVDAFIEEAAAEGVEVDRVCVLALVSDAADDLCPDTATLEELTADDPVLNAGFDAQFAADELFAQGLENSTKSVDYQAALVIFAVGLALSAWAALSDTSSRARLVFMALASISLVVGLARLLTV